METTKLEREIAKTERKLKQSKIDLVNEENAYKVIIENKKQGIKAIEQWLKDKKKLV